MNASGYVSIFSKTKLSSNFLLLFLSFFDFFLLSPFSLSLSLLQVILSSIHGGMQPGGNSGYPRNRAIIRFEILRAIHL